MQGHSARLFLLLVLAGLLTGCLSRPSLVKQSFAFAIPPPTRHQAPATDWVLEIRRVSIAAPFDSQSLVYRAGEFSYERDPYAEFLVPPTEGLGVALADAFRGTGAFRAVTEPGSALPANALVEIYVDQLYGDFRNRAAPAAVLSMRLIFFDTKQGLPGPVLLQRHYHRRVALKARTAAALVAGWNQALEQIVEEAARDCSTATRNRPVPRS